MELFMAFLRTTEFVVPVGQMLLLLMVSTICLFFRRIKLGLLINYLFSLYWGYFCNQGFIASHTSNAVLAPVIYFGLGVALVVIAVITFFSEDQR